MRGFPVFTIVLLAIFFGLVGAVMADFVLDVLNKLF